MFKKINCWILFFNLFFIGTLAEATTIISEVSISPDGKKIAFVKQTDTNKYLNVYSLQDKKALTSLDLANVNPVGLMFVNNQQLYMMLSDDQRIDGFQGKNDISSGFVLDLETKTTRQILTPGLHYIYPGQVGLGRLVGVSEDGINVVIPSFLGTTEGILGDNPPPPKFGLVKVNLQSTKRPKIIAKGNINSKDFFLNSKGQVLLEERFEARKGLHTLLVYEGKKSKEIFNEKTSSRAKRFIGLMDNEKSVIFHDANEKSALSKINLDSGTISKVEFGEDIITPIIDINRHVKGFVVRGSPIKYKFFDEALNRRVENIVESYPGHAVFITDWSPDWKHIVIKVQGPNYQNIYFLSSLGTDKPQYLTAESPK